MDPRKKTEDLAVTTFSVLLWVFGKFMINLWHLMTTIFKDTQTYRDSIATNNKCTRSFEITPFEHW